MSKSQLNTILTFPFYFLHPNFPKFSNFFRFLHIFSKTKTYCKKRRWLWTNNLKMHSEKHALRIAFYPSANKHCFLCWRTMLTAEYSYKITYEREVGKILINVKIIDDRKMWQIFYTYKHKKEKKKFNIESEIGLLNQSEKNRFLFTKHKAKNGKEGHFGCERREKLVSSWVDIERRRKAKK